MRAELVGRRLRRRFEEGEDSRWSYLSWSGIEARTRAGGESCRSVGFTSCLRICISHLGSYCDCCFTGHAPQASAQKVDEPETGTPPRQSSCTNNILLFNRSGTCARTRGNSCQFHRRRHGDRRVHLLELLERRLDRERGWNEGLLPLLLHISSS